MDEDFKKADILDKFNCVFKLKNWERCRLIFALIKMDYPDEAKKLLERMTKDERGFMQL